jgi:hypothetical protein
VTWKRVAADYARRFALAEGFEAGAPPIALADASELAFRGTAAESLVNSAILNYGGFSASQRGVPANGGSDVIASGRVTDE